ncbi:hypothetical protein MTBBW1_2670010 [Desulfamplus magnetovallimortis]|uniref:Uncharacterized protein n=1 Tax=Desulfamplus magnetovallimortis TaxID=1246637 RepID=A0A1W1HF34_9BACT|nr:hypothetical protein MTBBW1_2670010 [Desulfamplus magnetovallimortis]
MKADIRNIHYFIEDLDREIKMAEINLNSTSDFTYYYCTSKGLSFSICRVS